MELSESELELFELAYTLGVSIDTVLDMPFTVYEGWRSYFKQRPVGWREDYRTHMIMRSNGWKHSASESFSSIKQMEAEASKGVNLKGTKMLALMQSSLKGDKVPWA